MFVGIMILAYAMEHVRLHRRLALLVLRYVGASITWCVVLFFFFILNTCFNILNRSMAGLIGVTAFLSMWINNSAAANIMIPTALAIVNELQSRCVTDEGDIQQNATDDGLTDCTSKLYFDLNI